MSRIGKKPIPIPKGVTVKVARRRGRGAGPEGQAAQAHPAGHQLRAGRRPAASRRASDDDPELGKFHGLARSLVANAVDRRDRRLQAELDIVGVGYRAEVKGKQVIFALGYSHPVVFDIPTGIDIAIDKQTHITVTGVDRQLVGQVAAEHPPPAQARPVQAEGRALHRRSAEEEGRKDRREVAAATRTSRDRAMKIKTKDDRRDRIQLRQRKRIAGTRRAAAPARVPQRRAHLRAGHRRPDAARRSRRRRASSRRSRARSRRTSRGGNLKGAEAIGKAIAERLDREGHHARRVRPQRLPVSRPRSRRGRRRAQGRSGVLEDMMTHIARRSTRRSSTSRTPSCRSTA